MITVSNVSLTFGGQKLFSGADLKFMPGNCYGVIVANGAGKSTFLKLLSGELEPTSGDIFLKPGARMSVLKQDQTMYDAYTVMDTVIMGNAHLYEVMKEKDAIYAKDEMTDEDGIRAAIPCIISSGQCLIDLCPKGGKITYRADKAGNVQAIIGKVSFETEKLVENFKAFNDAIQKAKPATAKGTYITNLSITTTQGAGIKVDPNSL